MLFLCYPKCSTCRKAQEWLDGKGVEYELRDIKINKPSIAELREWHAKSGLPINRLWNTSGMNYRALLLKDKLAGMSEEEQLDLLATDGMLVKRPILVGDDFVLVGYKQDEWEKLIG